jgi:hypothetical protein
MRHCPALFYSGVDEFIGRSLCVIKAHPSLRHGLGTLSVWLRGDKRYEYHGHLRVLQGFRPRGTLWDAISHTLGIAAYGPR